MHDADTIRTTGVQGLVAGRTFADLRKLDAGSWKHPDFSGARVPALEEVLSAIPADKQAIIEIKCGSEILVPLRDILDASGVASSRLLIHCFDFDTLCDAKRVLPDIRACWLVDQRETNLLPLLEKARAAGLYGLNPQNTCLMINKSLVDQAHSYGIGIYVWTVNSAERARELMAAGVDGLLTDRPGWLREQLSPPPPVHS